MQSKLQRIAETFVKEVGDNLHNYTFVFPNHRAGLFFRKYLSQHVTQPIFAPRVMSINECFYALTDLQVADSLTLLLRLYNEYQRLRPNAESLERFIYWGKMMLSDFSEIDNHLVEPVEALFASIQDIHALEERFHYLTDNQRKALSQFWKEFQYSDTQHPKGELHTRFLSTWDLLYPLYTALRNNLLQDGLAYEGMLHREVLTNWDSIPIERFQDQYVFLGFNALTASERELMLRLQAMNRADFYFDYDSPYLHDPHNRASLFMESNLRSFRSRYNISEQSEASSMSDITLLSVPSTVSEVHEVHRILQDIIPSSSQDLTRTAVVLPDEQLLIPLLNAFPEVVDKINVTMGYPLRATSLYMPVAYPEQFIQPISDNASIFITQMREYLQSKRDETNAEGVYQLTKALDRLDCALVTYPQIAFTTEDIKQLFKMLTLETTIPYVGEPLDGLQVMGVLETRALDFDNVIITGFNDELYPGRAANTSFIPYTLRHGFDLPTPDRQNAIFAYNFYRMLSYAKHVWLITNSTADEQHSGEVSRYFYQLKWQYGMDIQHRIVALPLDVTSASSGVCSAIAKDERTQQLRKLSASALSTYLRCPKSFYYKHIEHLSEPEKDESISVSDLTLGNVLHAIMQELYTPFIGLNITSSTIEELLDKVNDNTFWATLSPLQDLKGDLLAEHVVRTYVTNILQYDYTQTPFQFLGAEKKVEIVLPNNVTINGTIDRIDLQQNTVRIIDYKTGSVDLEYTSMQDVFGIPKTKTNEVPHLRNKGKSQILQTMLYCFILSDEYRHLAPYVYSTRRIADPSSITCVHPKHAESPLIFDATLRQEFQDELMALISEILNPDIPYSPTDDSHACDYCAFAQLCGKKAH